MALFLGEHAIDLFAGQPVKSDEETVLESLTATPTTSTQTFLPSIDIDGWNRVTVNPIPSQYIIPEGSTNITQNGTFDVGQYASAIVNVPGIVPSGTLNITSNNTYDVTQYASAKVNVPVGQTINNQNKSVTPTQLEQSITADSGYTGLGTVTVEAIENTYIGSEVTQRDSTDLTASGATITVPAGYYANQASKAVSSGSAGTPSASKGTVTNHSISVTPSVTNTTGYITGGTKTGTAVTVSANQLVSGTLNINSNGTQNVTNYASVNVNVPISGEDWVVIVSNNLHDSSEDVSNTYISGSTETSYNGWTSTGYIPVQPNTWYQIINGPNNNYNAFYKSDKSAALPSVQIYSSSGTGKKVSLIKTTEDTYYIRMSATSSAVASFDIREVDFNMPEGNLEITSNGTYNVSPYEEAIINVPTGSTINNQDKNVTPSENQQSVTADSGYTGLGTVTVGAISDTYIGSAIDRNDSSDLTVSGNKVTAPAGYYAAAASASIATGTATTPTSSITANPSISVNSSGLITATASGSKSITPTVSAGYITTGTAGTVSVSGSNTQQLSTQAAATITPNETSQTAVASGKYTTGAVTVAAIPSTYVGSDIDRRDSDDLTSSGATVTVPAGYYSESASKSISSGSVTAPSSISGTTATVSTGTNTLTLTKSVSVTPNVTTAGYISSGTAGSSSVSLTANVTTKAAATITPGTSSQTISSGTYLTGTQTIAGDTDLVAGNIKADTSIFNVTGTFTSDATAAASDIVSGQTAYVNGSKVTGSLVVQKYYTGSTTPSSSLGNNGDIYIQS